MNEVKEKKINVANISALPILGKQPDTEKEEKFLREVCEFEFYNLEEPGLVLRFPYGNTCNNHNFTLFHGGKYQLPRFIARHVESKGTPIWEWRPDGKGSLQKKQVGHKPRFRMSQVFS